MKLKRIALAGVALIVLAGTTATIYAETETPTATLDISGGVLSLATAAVTLDALTLDGTQQLTASAAASNTWTVVDSRGTGDGWNVTVKSTDFSDGGSNTLVLGGAVRKFKIQLTAANITFIAGGGGVTTAAAGLTEIPTGVAPPLKIASAASGGVAGTGTNELNPNFTLDIPADTLVGNGTYTATLTVTVSTGP